MNSFITRGGWWVVTESVLILAVLAGGVVFRADERHVTSLVLGGSLNLLGAAFGIAGVKALGRNRTPFPKPREDSALVQHGVYALVRHPLYSSVILVSFGWALVWGSVPALALACVEVIFFDAKLYRVPSADPHGPAQAGGTRQLTPTIIITADGKILMKTNPSRQVSHKLGANRNELAKKARKHDPNFAQSRDVREDRSQRQAQTGRNPQTLARGSHGM